jgi:hypothetical protein
MVPLVSIRFDAPASFLWSVSSVGSSDAFLPEPADPPDLSASGSHGPEPHGSYDLPIIQPCDCLSVPVAWPCGQWGSPCWLPSVTLRFRLSSSSRFPSGLTRPLPARQCIPFKRIVEREARGCSPWRPVAGVGTLRGGLEGQRPPRLLAWAA